MGKVGSLHYITGNTECMLTGNGHEAEWKLIFSMLLQKIVVYKTEKKRNLKWLICKYEKAAILKDNNAIAYVIIQRMCQSRTSKQNQPQQRKQQK